MRMWLVNPEKMCQKHLCGEHLEMHMFLGCLKKNKKIDGYLKNNLLEPFKLISRHDELAVEMKRRGYNHNTPVGLNERIAIALLEEKKRYTTINKKSALNDLLSRCPECSKRFIGG